MIFVKIPIIVFEVLNFEFIIFSSYSTASVV
jgi:hypothetical protein